MKHDLDLFQFSDLHLMRGNKSCEFDIVEWSSEEREDYVSIHLMYTDEHLYDELLDKIDDFNDAYTY